MRKKKETFRFNSTIEKVFSKYGHEHEAPDCKVVKVVGRKQRRREAKLQKKKNKLPQNNDKTIQHVDKKEVKPLTKKIKNENRKRKVRSSSDVKKKALRLENKHEDKVIATLEKKLFLNKSKKGKKLPKSFVDSGLDYILDVVNGDFDHDSEDDSFSKTLEPQLSNKKSEDECCEDSAESDDESSDDESSVVDYTESEDDAEDTANDVEIDGKVEDSELNVVPGKYIPPAKRIKLSDEQERNIEKLSRKLKGLLNRLSEANLKSICDDIETLYLNNSRAVLHKVMADALMNQFYTPDPAPESMLIENAMLISTLSVRVGIETLMHIYEVISLKLESLIKTKGTVLYSLRAIQIYFV